MRKQIIALYDDPKGRVVECICIPLDEMPSKESIKEVAESLHNPNFKDVDEDFRVVSLWLREIAKLIGGERDEAWTMRNPRNDFKKREKN